MALSLILSLLSYKPAPLYILDEIDAALDLSHTQVRGPPPAVTGAVRCRIAVPG